MKRTSVLVHLSWFSLSLNMIFAHTADADCIDYTNYLHWVSTVALPGFYGQKVAVYGSRAYVAARTAGLQVFDLTDPDLPVLVGSVDTPSDAQGVSIAGSYAYIADGASGLQVINVSNPSAPVIVGSIDTPGSALDVNISGSYAYVADNASLQVIDVSVPASPTFVTSWSGQALAVPISGTYAYVLNGAGFNVIDISNPLSIAKVGGIATCQANDLDVSGSYACVAGYCALQVIDVSNPASPVIVGSVATGGTVYSVTVSGTHAYVGTIIDGLTSVGDAFEAIDISNPASPVIVGKVMGPHGETAVSGDHAYVVGPRNQGFHVFYLGNSSSPLALGSLQLPVVPFTQIALAVSGNYVYVSGLKVIDVSNPASPQIVGSVDTPSRALAISGSYVYVANDYLFRVIDVSNPTSPTIVSTLNNPWPALGPKAMAVSGNVAYVLVGQSGLYGVDVSNPAAPVVRGMTSTSTNSANDVAVSGSYAYVCDYSAGIRVIQLSPYPSGIVRTVDTPGGAYGIDISGSYAYVADGDRLRVLDISTPTAAAIVGSLDTQGQSAVDVVVSGSYAYVHEQDGVSVVDITSPAFPKPLGSLTIFSGTTQAHHIAASPSLVFTTDWHFLTGGGQQGRFVVLPSQCPSAQTGINEEEYSRVRIQASPNPFQATVDLHFDLERAEHVSISVLDLQGRKVADLLTAEFPSGQHRVTWKGWDDSHQRVGPGIYFARLNIGDRLVRVQKLFKVR